MDHQILSGNKPTIVSVEYSKIQIKMKEIIGSRAAVPRTISGTQKVPKCLTLIENKG